MLPADEFASLPERIRELVAAHFVADQSGNYDVFEIGLDDLTLVDYVNYAHSTSAANLEEVDGVVPAGMPQPFKTVKAISAGEELLLPPLKSVPKRYCRSPATKVKELVARLEATATYLAPSEGRGIGVFAARLLEPGSLPFPKAYSDIINLPLDMAKAELTPLVEDGGRSTHRTSRQQYFACAAAHIPDRTLTQRRVKIWELYMYPDDVPCCRAAVPTYRRR